jgi:hypothetical protein
MTTHEGPEHESHARFRVCAEQHGLRLHRAHLLSATRTGSFPSTWVFDCVCGQRWLLRVSQADAVPVDGVVLERLRRERDGQPTAPPGFPGLSVDAEPRAVNGHGVSRSPGL